MARYSKKQQAVSPETQAEAMQAAKATQRQGQTKEQTKLIAQGVQKGIELYKKQQKERARELNKKLKKVSGQLNQTEQIHEPREPDNSESNSQCGGLAWFLLLASWCGFALYEYFL